MDAHERAVLCDLGLSRIFHKISRTLTTPQTSENYRFLAPELLASDDPLSTPKSDMYALGMTFLELGTFKPPFSTIKFPMRAADAALQGQRPPAPTSLCGLNGSHLQKLWSLFEQ